VTPRHRPATPQRPAGADDVTLRLLWPQWQGAGSSSVRQFASEFPFDVARRGYAVGSAILDAVLAPHDGPTARAPVTMGDEGVEERDGVEAKAVIVEQATPTCRSCCRPRCPRTGSPWSDCTRGPRTTCRTSPRGASGRSGRTTCARRHGPLLDWLAGTGCSRVALHFDVDTIDADELVLGLGAEPDGLTSAQVRRIVADVDAATDVVGLTIAEFFPRQVMHLRQILAGSR
jgi:hypothetical protein